MRSEEEQAEILKEWWEKNGRTLIITIVLSVVALLGWRQWNISQDASAANASVIYENMVSALERSGAGEDADAMAAAREHAEALTAEYPRSSYAGYARLALARLAVMDGDYEAAAEQLRAVVDRSPTRALEYTARLRLARVLLQSGDTDAALAQAERSYPDAWQAQALEVKGDALRQDQPAAARDAYRAALDAMPAGDSGRDRVQMKLDDMMSAS